MCLHLSNSIYYPVLLLAVIGIGAVYLGTNPAYSATELTHQLKHGEAKWIITETGGEGHPILKTVEKAMSPCGIPKDKVLIFDHEDCDGDVEVPEGWTSWRSLLTHGEQDWIRFDNYERSRSTTAALMFSSGTTGFPKAIMISHMNIVAQTVGVFVDHPREYHISRIASLPMFHAAIGMPTNYSTLKEGQTSYIYKRFDPTEYLLAHAKYEVTEMLMVPPLVVACIKSSLPNKKECLKTVRWVQCGAAPMSKETQSPFQALLAPGANITQVFGMTEGASLVFLFPTGEADDSGSSGRQITNLEVKYTSPSRFSLTLPYPPQHTHTLTTRQIDRRPDKRGDHHPLHLRRDLHPRPHRHTRLLRRRARQRQALHAGQLPHHRRHRLLQLRPHRRTHRRPEPRLQRRRPQAKRSQQHKGQRGAVVYHRPPARDDQGPRLPGRAGGDRGDPLTTSGRPRRCGHRDTGE